MSRKSMRPARKVGWCLGRKCPICNPPKGEWTERWKERKAPLKELNDLILLEIKA
jgi:hypothetical protein